MFESELRMWEIEFTAKKFAKIKCLNRIDMPCAQLSVLNFDTLQSKLELQMLYPGSDMCPNDWKFE